MLSLIGKYENMSVLVLSFAFSVPTALVILYFIISFIEAMRNDFTEQIFYYIWKEEKYVKSRKS